MKEETVPTHESTAVGETPIRISAPLRPAGRAAAGELASTAVVAILATDTLERRAADGR